MPAVSDSSPLIILAKIERLHLLPGLCDSVLVPPRVWDEAVTAGKQMGARDVARLERLAAQRLLQRVVLTRLEADQARNLTRHWGLGAGEAETIAVAARRSELAIVDDKSGRAAAATLGIPHTGTIGVLYEAFLSGMLTYDELAGLLEQVSKVAWISPDLLAGVLNRGREAKKL